MKFVCLLRPLLASTLILFSCANALHAQTVPRCSSQHTVGTATTRVNPNFLNIYLPSSTAAPRATLNIQLFDMQSENPKLNVYIYYERDKFSEGVPFNRDSGEWVRETEVRIDDEVYLSQRVDHTYVDEGLFGRQRVPALYLIQPIGGQQARQALATILSGKTFRVRSKRFDGSQALDAAFNTTDLQGIYEQVFRLWGQQYASLLANRCRW